MMGSRTCKRTLLALVSALACGAPPALAQDMDLMAKWTEVAVVRWRVVGEFTGEAVILSGKQFTRSAQVTDRVELEFDWDLTEMKAVGKPVLRNFPTKVGAFTPGPTTFGSCPAPRVEGTFELLTAVAVKEAMFAPAIEAKRDQPGGAIPYPGPHATGTCGDAWDAAAPKSEVTTKGLPIPPPMVLAMPPTKGIDITPDRKSIIVKSEGWVWTATPTPVK
jgi:hypothetical protein